MLDFAGSILLGMDVRVELRLLDESKRIAFGIKSIAASGDHCFCSGYTFCKLSKGGTAISTGDFIYLEYSLQEDNQNIYLHDLFPLQIVEDPVETYNVAQIQRQKSMYLTQILLHYQHRNVEASSPKKKNAPDFNWIPVVSSYFFHLFIILFIFKPITIGSLSPESNRFIQIT